MALLYKCIINTEIGLHFFIEVFGMLGTKFHWSN